MNDQLNPLYARADIVDEYGYTSTVLPHVEVSNIALKSSEVEDFENGGDRMAEGDTISRQAVIDTIDKWAKNMHILIALPANEVTPLFESVYKLPPVAPQQKTGHWIKHEGWNDDTYSVEYSCSECNEWVHEKSNFCPSCGAKMEVEE